MGSWIEANLEPAEGATLDLHETVDRFVRRSTRADRRAVPDPEASLRELLPVEGRTILNHRMRLDMRATPGAMTSDGPTYRKPKHKSVWSD